MGRYFLRQRMVGEIHQELRQELHSMVANVLTATLFPALQLRDSCPEALMFYFKVAESCGC